MNASFSSITKEFPCGATPVYPFPQGVPATVTTYPESLVKERPVISPREQAYQISGVLMIGDWAVSSAAIFLGLQLREWQRMGAIFDARHHIMIGPMLSTWSISGGAVFTWIMLMLKTYDNANLYRMQRLLKNLLRSIVLWSVAIWAYIGLFQITDFTPRIGVLYCTVALFGFLGLWRLTAFTFLIQPRVKERVSSKAIVVGWNDTVSRLHKAMRHDLAQLHEIIGCVPSPSGHFGARPPPQLAVLGDYAALPQIAAECNANSIILADCSCSAHDIQRLAAYCQRELLGFKMIVPEYFPALSSALQVETVSGVPLLGVSKLPLDRTRNRVIKRMVDVCGAIVGLVLSAPIVLLFMVLVYLESSGPVIYRQRRTSRAGRTFFICKIRSMQVNAEAATGAVWCKKGDDRRLRVGAFMRKYNIDELPQFWNVLRGDMSLVGPRPERPELIERFKGEIPNYNARHEVRAGLTGWAQIHGLRGDTDLTKRVEADLHYLENWSLMLDFYCMIATFFKIQNAH
jgi:exopolysaccharide biosynthesis polyprenyl glycosylphosphotransferase